MFRGVVSVITTRSHVRPTPSQLIITCPYSLSHKANVAHENQKLSRYGLERRVRRQKYRPNDIYTCIYEWNTRI